MAWVYLRHDVTGGDCLVPDEPGVVEAHEARGWARYVMPAELDPDAPNTGVSAGEPERVLSEEESLALKGKALDEALDAAGLPKTGSADEKRERLAAHEAELANTTTEEGTD